MSSPPPVPPTATANMLGLLETSAPAAVLAWLEDWLFHSGAVSVSESGVTRLEDEARDTPPGWPVSELRALYNTPAQAESAARSLQALGFNTRTLATSEEALLAPARERLPPRTFAGRLVVLGTDDPPPRGGAEAVVRLDPGTGFGTGTHPSTALCLDWLARQNLEGLLVLDYGTGSGILGLAALALGAQRVWGIDTDPLARAAARDNARANGYGRRFLVRATPARPPFAADLICANLLRNILLALAPRMARLHRPGGHLLLSGLLVTQAEDILTAYGASYVCAERIERADWTALVLHHRESRR